MAMGTMINCCLNLNSSSTSPPPPPSSLNSSKNNLNLVSWKNKKTDGISKPWMKNHHHQCIMIGIASVIIVITGSGNTKPWLMGTNNNYSSRVGNYDESRMLLEQGVLLVESDKKKLGGIKWSEKRGCPSWKINSFETIVPENLPRPSSRRKSESITLPSTTTTTTTNISPSPKTSTLYTIQSDCFYM